MAEQKSDTPNNRSADTIRAEIHECRRVRRQKEMEIAALEAELECHPEAIAQRLFEWGVPEAHWAVVERLTVMRLFDWHCNVTIGGRIYKFTARCTHTDPETYEQTFEAVDFRDDPARDWDTAMHEYEDMGIAFAQAHAIACLAFREFNS
jgi:hypothetical protein